MSAVMSEYAVESMFIDRLVELDYPFVAIKNYDELLANFRKQLCAFNQDELIKKKGVAELSDDEFGRVMLHLDNHPVYESAKILRDEWVLELDNGDTVYLRFLSADESQNKYQVTHQVTMDPEHKDDVLYKNRYDVTILINGLPLVQIELKRPGIELNEAINQINRYRRFSFRGLFRYLQIFVVSNSTQTKYYANANENMPDGTPQNILKSLVFFWTDKGNRRINRLIDFTNDFFPRQHLTAMLTKYFVIKQTEPILMVMRPYQVYAVQGAYERVIGSAKDGYCFHCTGSGKTLTSFKLATLLRDNPTVSKVVFLVDRKDLDDQTIDEYNSFEPDCVDSAERTSTLVNALKDPEKKMIVTTIQKMAYALKTPRYEAIMDTYRNKKVVFIIDECHRSQFGTMHGSIRRHFQKANYVGFTGTPIFAENKTADGRTTADVFATGTDALSPCIHSYMIKEAIADGNVLRFSVEFMRTMQVITGGENALDPARLEDPAYCTKNGLDLNGLYHEQKRIEFVADDILEHLDRHIHPEGSDIYTALFAIDRISTLMKYYRYMREHNPKGYKIAAIFTFAPNEDVEDEGVDRYSREELQECMDDYNEMFGTHFDVDSFDAYRRNISERMKQKSLPQVDLLLVVNMFLTGWDSKPTNTLILDKNLEWQGLVQAYSRTNRVHKRTKQFGQIISYRDIKKAQDAALKLYSGDGNPNDYLLESYDYYVSKYRENVERLREIAETADDAGYLVNEDEQIAFVRAFRRVAHTLAVTKTFSKFDWADLDPFLDEAEYSDYKSWYLTFYDDQARQARQGIESALGVVDFNIELIRTDKINVVYILNLLKDINRKDPEKKKEAIDLILREIERSDNAKLRYKRDILKAFITDRFFDIDPAMDITAAYEEYENEVKNQRIAAFAEENGIKPEIINDLVNEYFCNPKLLTKENIRQKILYLHLGLLKTTAMIEKIELFVQDTYDTFTSEGV